jgi:hypothetical protein
MTTADRDLLVQLVVYPGMHLHPVTAESAIHFIHGYEAGARGTCDLTKQLRDRLSGRHRLPHRSDGWPGQLARLAQKRASTWLILFRRLTLELIVEEEGGRLRAAQQALLQTRIGRLVERVESTPPAPPDADTVEDWRSLCAVESEWFQRLWTPQEWDVIQRADAVVQTQGAGSQANP